MISSNPDILSGRPCIAGTRIPVSAIKNFYAAGYDAAEIMREYPGLTPAQIEAAIAYQETHQEAAIAKDLAAALRRSIRTACNDDDSPPLSERRRRHAQRIAAMANAAEFLDHSPLVLPRCPFCGSSHVMLTATGTEEQSPAIVCQGCGVVVTVSGAGVDDLVAAWGRRA